MWNCNLFTNKNVLENPLGDKYIFITQAPHNNNTVSSHNYHTLEIFDEDVSRLGALCRFFYVKAIAVGWLLIGHAHHLNPIVFLSKKASQLSIKCRV